MTPAARGYAQESLGRFLHLTSLTANDRDAVKSLLEQQFDDLEMATHTTRTVWVATSALRQPIGTVGRNSGA